MDDVTEQRSACTFRDALIDLLGQYPRRGSGVPGDSFVERLNGLETEARRCSAPSGTIAAIRGVRVLLDLAELPLLPALRASRMIMAPPPAEQSTPL